MDHQTSAPPELSDVVVAGPGVLCLLTSDGRCHQVSAGLCELLGCTAEELIGRRGVPSARVRRRDGGERWLDWQCTPVGDGYHLYVGHDVTAHRLAERRLTIQLATATALGERGPLADVAAGVLEAICDEPFAAWQAGRLWWLDRDAGLLRLQGHWVSGGQVADHLASVSPRRSCGRGEGLPGRAWETAEPVWIEDTWRDDARAAHDTAPQHGFRAACAVPVTHAGAIVGAIELYGADVLPRDEPFLDILRAVGLQLGQAVERRAAEGVLHLAKAAAERALEDTEGRLRTVLSHAPIVLFAIDRDGRFTSIEGRATEALALGFGATPSAVIGEAVFERCRHAPELVQSCRLALAGNDHTASFVFDGGRHYDARFEALRDEGGRAVGAVAVLLDVTEHKDTEEALIQSELLLADAGRLAALGSLAGGVAHQINNALTSARLSLNRLVSFELARRPVTPTRLHRIELLQDAREGIGRVEKITRELKSFSRAELEPSGPVDVREVLDGVIRVTAHEIRHRALLVCEYREVPAAHGTAEALRQVFLNLIMNAAQSISEGEAHLNEVRVTTRTDPEGRVVVEVRDTGAGIPANEVDQIFEPFFTTRPAGQGLGLGLSICRDNVHELGGEITAESVVGEGTTLRVTLPSAERRHPAASPAVIVLPRTSGRGRVLIVDDDRPVAAAVALELGEHDVVVAGSGREALEILHRDRGFDVVVCDLMMPEVSGMDLYQGIAPHDPDLASRFVFMTGGAFTLRAQRFLAEVANPRLDKPFSADELRALVRGMTGRRADDPRPAPPVGGQKVSRTPKRADSGE